MSAHRRPASRRKSSEHRVRTVAIAGAAAVGLMVSGVAFATWITSGDGQGPVSSASIQPLQVDVPALSGLYPGATSPVTVTITNPNPYPLDLVDVTATSDNSACYTALRESPTKQSLGAARATGTFSDNTTQDVVDVSMPLDAPPSCAAQTFTLSVHVDASIGD